MNVFKLHEFTASVRAVLQWSDMCDVLRTQNRGAERFGDEPYKQMLVCVGMARDVCRDAGFIQCSQKIGLIYQRLDIDRQRADSSYIAGELLNAYDAMLEAAVTKRFLKVSMSRSMCIDNPNLMGSGVVVAFPSAKADIIESGNCLAAECNTAAVFHLMRVVEWGLRAFCVHLGFKKLRITKKSGKVKYVPVDFLEWEKILDKLQGLVDAQIERMRPGLRKQSAQEFYYPALQDIRAIRDAWRNHTMHNRREFSRTDAEAIFGHVQRLMNVLASRFSGPSRARVAIVSRVRQSPASAL